MSATISRPNAIEFGVSKPSEIITTLLKENANHEVDWLWAAEQAETTAERYFCLAYALYINPDNAEARRALAAHFAETRQQSRRQPAPAWSTSLRQLLTSVLGS